ncbi:hypothetical protein CJ030_MR5G003300 [Morella rubra]|uniref:Uncharacterized protein n=1 Tax=Morella rubra TaxID=262757 RepID=A0A6A1VPW3_9ROSI|nr:hypothetical protein CJ030_MR5G003300 [Morella rubra]
MAQKLVFAFLFLALVFSQQTQCIEGGRLLVGKHNEVETEHKMSETTETKTIKHGGMLQREDTTNEATTEASPPPPPPAVGESQPPPPTHSVDAFRPTAPGHSPGVGHSVHH